MRYGGNTTCVEIRSGQDIIILDGGTGLREFGLAEYARHRGWGHGCVDDSVALALKAGVKKLVLFHHDPYHDDRKIDAFLKHASQLVAKKKGKLKVEAAREGMEIQLGGKNKG